MRIFDHPSENFICPICGTNEDKLVTLIPIAGKNNGLTYEARQYHVDCIQVFEYVHPYNYACGANRYLYGEYMDRTTDNIIEDLIKLKEEIK